MTTVLVREREKGKFFKFVGQNEITRVKCNTCYNAKALYVNDMLKINVKNYSQKVKCQGVSFIIDGNINNIDNEGLLKFNINTQLSPTRFFVQRKLQDDIKLVPLNVFVRLTPEMVNSNIITTQKPYVVNVENLKTPSETVTNNSNVKSMNFTVQQQSFYELNINFEKGKIVKVENLPLGMIFEKQTIKGAPIYAGKYIVKITLDNEDENIITINVSSIPRKL